MLTPTRQQKLMVISGLAIVVIILLSWILFFSHKPAGTLITSAPATNAQIIPDFLSTTEKAKLGISAQLKVQALGRDARGQVTVYKIIKDDSDVVVDPSNIKPISPHHQPIK
jgi:hypothetical protein